MFAAGKTASTASGPVNYIEDVFSTYLYTGTGSTQFIENGITIGDTGNGGSARFGSTDSYLSVAGPATGATTFTLEFFNYCDSLVNGVGLAAQGTTDNTGGWILWPTASGNIGLYSNSFLANSTTGVLKAGVWQHIAVVGNSGALTIFVDGVSVATGSLSGKVFNNSPLLINRGYGSQAAGNIGRISNFRLVVGTALYTGSFTPPTAALTAISGTVLLCCQGSTPFTDNSTNHYAITQVGPSVSISSVGPFSVAGAGKGGLVWIKSRSAATNNCLFDTARGATKYMNSNAITASTTDANGLTAFGTTGFTLGSGNTTGDQVNTSAATFASWTFCKQPKFFDVVTYTGNGSNRTIAHNLGSTPGCIIVKRTDTTSNWQVYHNGLTSAAYSIQLNLTNAQASATTVWNSTAPTSSVFSVGTDATVNANGGTYVAYLFAHNAGGFGLTGTDNVISCGSYTSSTSSQTINLGFEPQWLLIRSATDINSWQVYDNMRGFSQTQRNFLLPNTSDAEGSASGLSPTATGFTDSGSVFGTNGSTIIYIAIRRGPMKVPTDATKVFSPLALNNAANTYNTTGFPIDVQIIGARAGSVKQSPIFDRLRGVSTNATESGSMLFTSGTAAEDSATAQWTLGFDNNGFRTNSTLASTNFAYWNFQRAPNFFDEVCYTGNGTSNNQSHNLAAVPELILVKQRNGVNNWVTLHTFTAGTYNYMLPGINGTSVSNSGAYGSGAFLGSQPTSAVIPFASSSSQTNGSSNTYIAYLFASCPGVSKVGSYTGNGTNQTINCGFTGGARFVLIKRTDDVGGWYVYDTARGMTTLTDPYLFLNSTAAEAATLGSVTTVTTGFKVDASILAAVNTNTASYIYLAVA